MKKMLVSALSLLAGAGVGAAATNHIKDKQLEEYKAMSDKHLSLFLLMNRWVKLKQDGKNLAEYFEREGYKKIAIYGMSYAGETLALELSGKDIEIAYGIDKNADVIYSDLNIMEPDDELEEVDAIIVTPITFFDEIKKKLSEKVNCPIISLEDVLGKL